MTERAKKWLFWLGIFPTIITVWGHLSLAVYHIDVIVEMVGMAAEKDEYGHNGLDKFKQRNLEHDAMWENHIKELTEQ